MVDIMEMYSFTVVDGYRRYKSFLCRFILTQQPVFVILGVH